jgi:hypothetical protein
MNERGPELTPRDQPIDVGIRAHLVEAILSEQLREKLHAQVKKARV